ncbi:phage head closure protein [Comamonas terrigena]|uniref:phage head closure protein n=1 Tax=Comamonas terrigena TaxID=32013 RepID=UPI0023543BF5|nr:phage head closure protein [Comamonas terrigena]
MQSAGKRNRFIHLERHDGSRDPHGAPMPDAWVGVASVWADVRHESGTESIRAGAEVSEVRASARISFRRDVVAGMRFWDGDAVYEIDAVLPGRVRTSIDLVCRRVS